MIATEFAIGLGIMLMIFAAGFLGVGIWIFTDLYRDIKRQIKAIKEKRRASTKSSRK